MISINISPLIGDKVKDIVFAKIFAEDVAVHPSAEDFDKAVVDLTAFLKTKFSSAAPSDDPVVSAVRRMYRQVGWEPTKYRPSSEALVRRLLQDKGLYRINNLVDWGNLVSAKFHIPMGLYDADIISGEVTFDVGNEDESYEGINKPLVHAAGKIILRDAAGVFGNPTADSARTCISDMTQNAWAVFFCPGNLDKDYICETVETLAGYYAQFVNGKIVTEIQETK